MARNSGGCRNCMLTCFRILQFILSLTALACGVYIVYVMYDMASSAHSIDESIQNLLNPTLRSQLEQQLSSNFTQTDQAIEDFALALNTTIVPVLHVLEGTPIRTIILLSVALWSTMMITYIFFAHRSANKHYDAVSYLTVPNTPSLSHRTARPHTQRNLRRNSRGLRISLSIFTLLAWIVALVCVIMLMLEYSVTMLTGGAEAKVAFSAIKPIIEKALKDVIEGADDHKILRALDIINDIFTVGAMAILALVSTTYCLLAELLGVFVACCVSGKAKQNTSSDIEEKASSYSPYAGPDTPSSLSTSTPTSSGYGKGSYIFRKKVPQSSVSDVSPCTPSPFASRASWSYPMTEANTTPASSKSIGSDRASYRNPSSFQPAQITPQAQLSYCSQTRPFGTA